MIENYNYWKTTVSVAEHEQKIRELNDRFIAGKVSREDVKREIAHWFGEDNPAFEQQQCLGAQINARISPKLRDKLNAEQYFALREKIREKILGCAEEDAEKARVEEARITGEFCPHCGSTEVKSYDRQKWVCKNKNCGKFFRKH